MEREIVTAEEADKMSSRKIAVRPDDVDKRLWRITIDSFVQVQVPMTRDQWLRFVMAS